MNKKIGTRMNLTLRVLCLKSSIPAYAPNGPKSATNRSLDSGILRALLLLLILSTPKNISEIMFTITKTKSRVELLIMVMRVFLYESPKLRLMVVSRVELEPATVGDITLQQFSRNFPFFVMLNYFYCF
jgi:hypothetical protein